VPAESSPAELDLLDTRLLILLVRFGRGQPLCVGDMGSLRVVVDLARPLFASRMWDFSSPCLRHARRCSGSTGHPLRARKFCRGQISLVNKREGSENIITPCW